MGSDAAIVQAARTSYGRGTKKVSEDRGLIRYLMRHWHTTPFEMVEFKFHIRVPMDAWRQWVRHRTANINEYSTRYSEAIDSCQTTSDEQWRLQAKDNKQGSSGIVTDWPDGYHAMMDHETPGPYLTQRERQLQNMARGVYEERLRFGVAREQARKDLPLSTYTEAYWKIDLHNLFHFLRLRMAKDAQLEIRTYADAMFELIQPIVPFACEAFQDYRLDAVTFSGPEMKLLRSLITHQAVQFATMGKRERKEFDQKLAMLGLPELA